MNTEGAEKVEEDEGMKGAREQGRIEFLSGSFKLPVEDTSIFRRDLGIDLKLQTSNSGEGLQIAGKEGKEQRWLKRLQKLKGLKRPEKNSKGE